MRRRRLSFVEAFRSATSSRSQSRTSLNLEDDEEEDSIGTFGTASRSKAFANSDSALFRRDSFSSINSASGRQQFSTALAQLQSSIVVCTTRLLAMSSNEDLNLNQAINGDHHQNVPDSEDSNNGFVKLEHPTDLGDYEQQLYGGVSHGTPSDGTSPLSPMEHESDEYTHSHEHPSTKSSDFGLEDFLDDTKQRIHDSYEGAAEAAGGVVESLEHAFGFIKDSAVEAANRVQEGIYPDEGESIKWEPGKSDDHREQHDFFAGETKQDYPYGGPDEPLIRVKRGELENSEFDSKFHSRDEERKHDTLSPSSDSGRDTVGNLLGDDSGSNSPAGHRGTSPDEGTYDRQGPLTIPEQKPSAPPQQHQHHHQSYMPDSANDALDQFLHSSAADKVLHKAGNEFGDDDEADLLLDADDLPRPPPSAFHHHGFETQPRPPTPPKEHHHHLPEPETPPVLLLHKAERKPSLSTSDSRKSILKHSDHAGPWVDFKSLDPRVLDLIYWRDPKKSAVVLSLTLLALIVFAKCSLITVFSYLGLAVLAGTLAFRVYKGIEAQLKKTDGGNPFRQYLDKELVVPHERVHQQVDVLLEHGQLVAAQLRRLFLVEDFVDTIKFGLLLWAFTYIGNWFSGLALLILMVLAVFSVPKFYEVYKEPIDANLAIVNEHIKKVTDMVYEKLPFLKKQKQS